MVNPVQVLLQAAADDDITKLRQTLSKKSLALSSQREALLLACECSSINFIREIIRLQPAVAYLRDHNGYTVLHTVVEGWLPVLIVEALIKSHPDGPQLCTLTDHECMTPFHIAAKLGNAQVLKVLMGACGSGSLMRVTSLHQTALHLALEHGQFGCFYVMMEELLMFDQESLGVLNLQDHHGDTVLHIAISKKQTLISKYLLAENPNRRPLVEAKIENNLGLTALQLHDQNSSAREDRHIRKLLINVELPKEHDQVVASMELSHNSDSDTSTMMASLTAKSLIMTAMSLIAAMTFGSLSFYRSIYTTTHPIPPNATLLSINVLPFGFYYLTVATATFVVCMFTTMSLLWSVHSQWSMYFRAVGLFLSTTTLFLFSLMVMELIPDFSVTTLGAHRISSLWVLGFYVVALLLIFFFTFMFITKLIFVRSKRFW